MIQVCQLPHLSHLPPPSARGLCVWTRLKQDLFHLRTQQEGETHRVREPDVSCWRNVSSTDCSSLSSFSVKVRSILSRLTNFNVCGEAKAIQEESNSCIELYFSFFETVKWTCLLIFDEYSNYSSVWRRWHSRKCVVKNWHSIFLSLMWNFPRDKGAFLEFLFPWKIHPFLSLFVCY